MSGPQRVLVVDDEIDIRETLEFVLRKASYEVATADSGISAVAAAKASHFDLVVTDLKMPGMDSAETITAIRAFAPDLPIVVATGYASEEATADFMRRGARDYIRKPFDLEEFLAVVKRILS